MVATEAAPRDRHGQPVKPPSYPLSSVDNALRVLLMLREHDGLRISQASESLELGRSTVHRLLAMLQYRGLVEQDRATKTYHVGPALLDLGFSVVNRIDIRRAARRHLEALAAEVGETTHLVVLHGRDVLFLDGIESPRVLRTASRTGMSLPAHCVSGGKAMLAELSLSELRTLYRAGRLQRVTPNSIVRRSELERELEHVRVRGFAINVGESEEGIAGIGASIKYPGGRPPAALVVGGPSERLTAAGFDEIGRAVVQAAAAVAAEVGGSPTGAVERLPISGIAR